MTNKIYTYIYTRPPNPMPASPGPVDSPGHHRGGGPLRIGRPLAPHRWRRGVQDCLQRVPGWGGDKMVWGHTQYKTRPQLKRAKLSPMILDKSDNILHKVPTKAY